MSSFDEMDAFEGASLSQRAMPRAATGYSDHLDWLNDEQLKAATTLDGPLLVLAGAGTGKTRCLISRIAELIHKRRARSNEILAVTFTNRAAKEMKDRVQQYPVDIHGGLPWMGTFHAICVKLLRRHAELVGLKSNFTILDTDDQLRLLRKLLQAEEIDEKRWPPRLLAGIIDDWKNKAWSPEKVPASQADKFNDKGVELYQKYQEWLINLNAVDFGDLLLHVVHIFQTHEDVLAQYQRWFRFILVDEYQDTNVAQYLWLRLLAGGHKNICCVGDDDQSIYGWRGAEVGNILRFEKDFPGAHVVRLEENYRSTPHILAAASSVISCNENRLGKELYTEEKKGEKVRLIGHWDGEEEARWIGEEIEAFASGNSALAQRRQNVRSQTPQQESERLAKGGKISSNPEGDIHQQNLGRSTSFTELGKANFPRPKSFGLDEIAILVRASHQMRAFEDRFLTIGLPYRVIGGPRFYERMEIRDAMAYFRIVTSPDDDLAFERIVNTPKRGLGDKAQQKIQMAARENGVSLLEGARICVETKPFGGKGLAELARLVDGIARWSAMTRGPLLSRSIDEDAVIDDGPVPMVDEYGPPEVSHVELAQIILDESGYTAHWQNDKTPEAPGRLENLKELVKALEQFENLQGFLEHVSLIMDNEQDDGGAKVSIMTLHAAKGLEFPAVFLPGWEDGLFPSQRSMDESGLKGLEEERRLAYVGITRAEEVCTISFAANRMVFGQWQNALPSRFIDELPEAHVDVLTPPGLYGGSYGAAGMGGGLRSGLEERVAEANVYNSPGWRRLQARKDQRPVSQPSEARTITIDMTASSSFETGERVFHQKFGYGTITGIEGDKLEIAFEKAGTKKVVSRFITPAASAADDVPF